MGGRAAEDGAGLNLAALAAGPVVAVLAVVCAVALRHVRPIGAGTGGGH
ncbi:hypothetical protein [Nocardiopsis sp. CC223A]|nr:hypothetical protein [Nocardiopsis sp. CC223A]